MKNSLPLNQTRHRTFQSSNKKLTTNKEKGMKMKKFTQIVIATLITSSSYADTLTFHGREQVLVEYVNADSYLNIFRKRVRISLHNPNNFSVKIRLNATKTPSGELGERPVSPETITINANSIHTYEQSFPQPSLFANYSVLDSNTSGGRMCDPDMYSLVTSATNTLNCNSVPIAINISWQDSFLRTSDSSIKSVAPITGTLDYYYFSDKSPEFF